MSDYIPALIAAIIVIQAVVFAGIFLHKAGKNKEITGKEAGLIQRKALITDNAFIQFHLYPDELNFTVTYL